MEKSFEGLESKYNFERVVLAYQARIYRFIQGFVADEELSLDLTQDTFLSTYYTLSKNSNFDEAFNTDESIKSIQPLIYRIARCKAIDALRHRNLIRFIPLKPTLSLDSNSSSCGWWEDLDPILEYKFKGLDNNPETKVILYDELKTAIEQIGKKKLLNLFLYLDGYSYKEISQITGESLSNIKTKIFRSKQSLRQVLAG